LREDLEALEAQIVGSSIAGLQCIETQRASFAGPSGRLRDQRPGRCPLLSAFYVLLAAFVVWSFYFGIRSR